VITFKAVAAPAEPCLKWRVIWTRSQNSSLLPAHTCGPGNPDLQTANCRLQLDNRRRFHILGINRFWRSQDAKRGESGRRQDGN